MFLLQRENARRTAVDSAVKGLLSTKGHIAPAELLLPPSFDRGPVKPLGQ